MVLELHDGSQFLFDSSATSATGFGAARVDGRMAKADKASDSTEDFMVIIDCTVYAKSEQVSQDELMQTNECCTLGMADEQI